MPLPLSANWINAEKFHTTGWNHVGGLVKGIITNAPPSMLPKEATPYCKGVRLQDGQIISDFGYTDYPVTANTKTNELNGSVMKLDQFYRLDGLADLICMTTTNLYQYN